MSKLFDFRGQTTERSDQAIFTLKDAGLHDDEGEKINTSDPLTASQRRSDSFLSFQMTVHPAQADPTCKHSIMNCRACVKLLLYLDRIDARINIQMMRTTHDLLFHLAYLDNGRKAEIGTLKKEKGCIFS